MANSINIGGTTAFPRAGTVLNDFTIYRPEYGGAGLLNDGADFANVRSTFAGGLLEGAQYNPATNRFEAVAPSGEYTTNAGMAAAVSESEGEGDGAFTLSELMGFEAALRGANFGGYPYESIFSAFEDKGKGTYDISGPGGTIFHDALYGTDADGKSVPMNEAVYGSRHARAGEVLDKGIRNNLIRARLAEIDRSGGSDGQDDGPNEW